MAKSPKILTLLIGLSLLAAAAVGAWVYLVTLPSPVVRDLARPEAETGLVLPTYQGESLGTTDQWRPAITDLLVADLDGDQLQDVVVCDAAANQVTWIRQSPRGVFTETAIGDRIPAPGRVAVGDFNQDGRLDLAIASLGQVQPNGDRIGRVVVLENAGESGFVTHVLTENVARVTDIAVADLNTDGRPDLVVGEFGADEGGFAWMENQGEWQFQRHPIATVAGVVGLAVADFDADRRIDVAGLSVQGNTEVRVFSNAGGGEFREGVVWSSAGDAPAGGGLALCDLNRDGRPDLVWTDGGNLHSGFPEPTPAHGLQWLENRVGGFVFHRIGAAPGAFGPVAADLDGDGHTDLVTVSPLNRAGDADAVWLMAWSNDGNQTFTPEPLAREPIRLYALAAGDLDGNGTPVLLTGAMHVFPPAERTTRLTLWRRQ